MGAAKNARKARRKAHRAEDRRPYIFDLETVHKLPSSGIGDYFLSSSLVTVWDPKEGRNVAIGQSVELTRDQLSEITKKGFHPQREAREEERPVSPFKSIFDHPFWLDKIDASILRKREYYHGRLDYTSLYQQIPAVTNSTAAALDRSRKSTYSWDDADLSDIELRIASQYGMTPRDVHKRMTYMKAYGAVEADFKRVFGIDPGVMPVTHRMAPRHQMGYLTGAKADILILDDLDDRIEKTIERKKHDQDASEVGSVPTHSPRTVGSDTP